MDCDPPGYCPWDFPGKNTGVSCHFLLQGIFTSQGSNPCLLCLLHWQVDSLPPSHLGSPVFLATVLLSDQKLKNKCQTNKWNYHIVIKEKLTGKLYLSEQSWFIFSFAGLHEINAHVLVSFFINGLTKEHVIIPFPKRSGYGQLVKVSHLWVWYPTHQGCVCAWMVGIKRCILMAWARCPFFYFSGNFKSQ